MKENSDWCKVHAKKHTIGTVMYPKAYCPYCENEALKQRIAEISADLLEQREIARYYMHLYEEITGGVK